MMTRTTLLAAGTLTALFLLAAAAIAQTPPAVKPAPAMERTGHQWRGDHGSKVPEWISFCAIDLIPLMPRRPRFYLAQAGARESGRGWVVA